MSQFDPNLALQMQVASLATNASQGSEGVPGVQGPQGISGMYDEAKRRQGAQQSARPGLRGGGTPLVNHVAAAKQTATANPFAGGAAGANPFVTGGGSAAPIQSSPYVQAQPAVGATGGQAGVAGSLITDPGEQWAGGNGQELTAPQIQQRRALNNLITQLPAEHQPAGRAIIDAGGTVQNLLSYVQHQQTMGGSRGATNAIKEDSQDKKDAEWYLQQNAYGPGGEKGHEAELRAETAQSRTSDADTRAAQARVERLQVAVSKAHGEGKTSLQTELADAQNQAKGGSQYATPTQMNNSPEARQQIFGRQQEIQQDAAFPHGGGKALSPNDPVAMKFFQAAGGDPNKAQQLAEQHGWKVTK